MARSKPRKRHREREPNASFGPQHSPITPAGYVEGVGRFARGAFRARGRRGVAARVVVWGILALFFGGVIAEVVSIVRRLLS